MDIIHHIAERPRAEQLDILAEADIELVRRFYSYYGIDERDPDSGDLIDLEVHALCLYRLDRGRYRERRRPARSSPHMTTRKKSHVMAKRKQRGESLWHPGDLLDSEKQLPDTVALVADWGAVHGKRPDAVDVVTQGPATAEDRQLVRRIRRAEKVRRAA